MSSARPPKGPTDIESVLKKVLDLQEDAAHEFRPDLSGVADRPEGEFPLLTPEGIRIDRERFGRLLTDILGVLEEWRGQSAFGGEGGLDLSADEPAGLLLPALEGKAELEKLGGDLGAEPATFAFAVRRALAPFLEAYARELRGRFDPESVLGGRCPVCGGEPFMAELDKEDGRRRLQCGLCRTQWRFPRLKCPFCANEDQETLGFLDVDAFAGYRADVCDSCGRYIKTLDRRRIVNSISLEEGDARTPQLDEAARERGYGLRLKAGTNGCASETG